MHRARVGDVQQPGALVVVEVTDQVHLPGDAVELAGRRLTVWQSAACTRSWCSVTDTPSSGQPLRLAYIRTVIDVHAPSAESSRP